MVEDPQRTLLEHESQWTKLMALHIHEGDTLVVNTVFFLDADVRAQLREAALRDCAVPNLSMIFLPSGVGAQVLEGGAWDAGRIEVMREVCCAALKLLGSPYRRPQEEDDPRDCYCGPEGQDWDALRNALAKAGFSWEELC